MRSSSHSSSSSSRASSGSKNNVAEPMSGLPVTAQIDDMIGGVMDGAPVRDADLQFDFEPAALQARHFIDADRQENAPKLSECKAVAEDLSVLRASESALTVAYANLP